MSVIWGLPWYVWTLIALAIALIYVRVWPRPTSPELAAARSPWRRVILRWFHALVWLLLAASFAARAFAGEDAGTGVALAALIVYAVFLVTLFRDRREAREMALR